MSTASLRRLPAAPGGRSGVTISLEGGLEEVDESFLSRATAASNSAIRARGWLFGRPGFFLPVLVGNARPTVLVGKARATVLVGNAHPALRSRILLWLALGSYNVRLGSNEST